MRMIFAMTALSIFALASSTASFAAPKQQGAPVMKSFNDCVALAKQRGFTTNDIEDTGGSRMNAARTFVLRCMQGRQR